MAATAGSEASTATQSGADRERAPARLGPEEQLQRQIVDYLRWALPSDAVYFAIPNGGWRGQWEAKRLKAMGVRAGMPDIGIVWRARLLWIELKAPKGRLSPIQQLMHSVLVMCGCDAPLVAQSLPEVVTWLESYQMPLRPRICDGDDPSPP